MGVPNTSTFSLQDVANEFGLGGGDGLQECFDDSDDSEFDSSYNPNSDGTDNNLLNFRNYGAVNLIQFSIDNSASYGNVATACANGSSTTLRNLWHNGSGINPSAGDTIYQDSAGLYTFTSPNYYYIPAEDAVMNVNNSGVVINIADCSPP